jgi:hypothetical protein
MRETLDSLDTHSSAPSCSRGRVAHLFGLETISTPPLLQRFCQPDPMAHGKIPEHPTTIDLALAEDASSLPTSQVVPPAELPSDDAAQGTKLSVSSTCVPTHQPIQYVRLLHRRSVLMQLCSSNVPQLSSLHMRAC